MHLLRAVRIASVATWGLGVLMAPAQADGQAGKRVEPYRQAPYEAPPPGFFEFRWSGFFAGAHLGGAHVNFEATETAPDPLVPSILDVLTYSQDGASIVGGVQAGWQVQREKFVAGVEVTYTAVRFDETTFSPLVTNLARSAELHDLVTLTGRLGYADGRWLAYAKGGWASAEIDVTFRDGAGAVLASSGGRENGWTAGIGIDYALTYNLFLGIEYNYLHFNASVAPPILPNTRFGDGEVDIQTLVVRLNYRFGAPMR